MFGDMNLPSNQPVASIPIAGIPEVPMPLLVPTIPTSYTVQPNRDHVAVAPLPRTMVIRVIWYISGTLSVLLAFRFVLALLGANAANGFALFIDGVTTPLVSPFISLFGRTATYGTSQFEVYTLVALAVYALIAWGLAALVTIARRQVI